MMTKEAFIDFVLRPRAEERGPERSGPSALPGGFEGFDTDDGDAATERASTFAKSLLEASGFGLARPVETHSVVRSSDAVARFLPEHAAYWPKTADRPFHTLLFEAEHTNDDLQAIPAFRAHSIGHLELAEDALARFADEALQGFQRRGQSVTADTSAGNATETLCIVSILDKRDKDLQPPPRLVCFATVNKTTESLETFHLTEAVRAWEPQLARDHLGLLYERQFKKLSGAEWQEAFTTTEERKQAEHLLEVCSRKKPAEKEIQEAVIDLLDSIAKSFGLRKRPNARRLQAFTLPTDHDIGMDPEERETKFGGKNPFGGVTLRDEKNRLLGYIVYPLASTKDADRLRKHLETYNRFHNVLVVYPQDGEATLELWQGRDLLTGKLRKDRGPKGVANVVNLLSRFFVVSRAKVKKPGELAQELAFRAKYLRRLAITELAEEGEGDPLRRLYAAFKEALVHDQTEAEFADAFAQTLTYGLLTARWLGTEDLAKAGERFTRQTALQHLPATSPFLNDMFRSSLSLRLDEQRGRLLWLVDDIADLLDRVDVTLVFGRGDVDADQSTDPVIHFYEPFLAAYDKELKNKRGVFFTPRPVVSYIVRSVHELLQTEFGLTDGLASTDTWADMVQRFPGLKIPDGAKPEDPFVCILDPATGTGTFLYECIEVIERQMKDKWCRELGKSDWKDPDVLARWNDYVPRYLLPRLYGYELMMASYAVAHLKLSFKLTQTGLRADKLKRLRILLTNSLENESESPQLQILEAFPSFAREALEVAACKKKERFTVVVGNPPYAGHSSNNQVKWIVDKVYDYKRGIPELQKAGQAKWLQDDYVKFFRLAEHLLQTSVTGVLGYVTNHSFLDNLTFKGMRGHLTASFSRILTLDLHGNSKKKERDETGGPDENVFDIQQGVAITLAVSNRITSTHTLACNDLVGTRESKYRWLLTNSAASVVFRAPVSISSGVSFDFRLRDHSSKDEYARYIALPLLFSENGDPAPGVVTTHDDFAISWEKSESIRKVEQLLATGSEDEARQLFTLCGQSQWSYAKAKIALRDRSWLKQVTPILYRPFDRRWTVFNPHVAVHRRERVMGHMLRGGNVGLICTRQTKDQWGVFVTNTVCAHKTCGAYDINFLFPLFLFAQQDVMSDVQSSSRANISPKLLSIFRAVAPDFAGDLARAVLGYCYAIFFSPEYRTRYRTFLVSDFPRVPMPPDGDLLLALSAMGTRLVELHTMNFHIPRDHGLARTTGNRECTVERVAFASGNVWIDPRRTCGFNGIPEEVWNFHIGGYQVCEKWLKDRKGRVLTQEDIEHYQKIVVAISETIRLMKEIDDVIDQHGGWPGAFVTSEQKP